MSDISELAHRFDSLAHFMVPENKKPTSFTIEKIETHFGIKLPRSLIEFSKSSRDFGAWFASLGSDYQSENHIIRINSYWRRRRRTKAIPRNLVIINRAFDEDCDCLDLDSHDAAQGEYAIVYWTPGSSVKDKGGATFREYMEKSILSWEERGNEWKGMREKK